MRAIAGSRVVLAAAVAMGSHPAAEPPVEDVPSRAEERADLGSTEPAAAFRFTESRTYRATFAISIRAARSDVRNVIATCPVPVNWPEQQVRLVSENKPQRVRTSIVDLSGPGAMLVVRVPALTRGAGVTVERVYEITRSQVEFTRDPSELSRPVTIPRDVREHLRPAPDFDDPGGRIAKLAESLRQPDDRGWTLARRYFDWVRRNVRFEQGDFRGARFAFEEQTGDCEDMTALFVALCRASGIPARDVWVEGHAYPEFYLADADGQGYWIPVQVSGPEWFGRMADYQPILQKGDRCRDPIRRRDVRYIPQSARAIGGAVELSVTRTIIEDRSGPE